MIINVLKRATDGSGAVASSCGSGSVHHHFSANYHGLISQWGCWLSSRGVLRRWFSGPTAVSGVSILCFGCPQPSCGAAVVDAGGGMDLCAGTALTCWVGGSGLCILGRLPKGSGSLIVLRPVRNLVGCSAVFHFASQADVLLREQCCLC